jgi:biotin operon repressor
LTAGLTLAIPQAIGSQGVSAGVSLEAKKIGGVFQTGFSSVMGELPRVIQGALQGGGDVVKSIGSLIGASFGEEFGKSVGEKLSKRLGGTMGQAIGGIMGPLGAMLGPLVMSMVTKLGKKVWEGIQGIFGTDEEARLVNPKRDEFLAQFGGAGTGAGSGFAALAAKLTELTGEEGGGALFRALTSADTMTEFTAAMAAVQAKLASATTGVEATSAATAGLNLSLSGSDEAIAALGVTQDRVVGAMLAGFDSLITKLNEFIALLSSAGQMPMPDAWTEAVPVPSAGATPASSGIDGFIESQAGRQLQYEDGTPIPSVPPSGYTLPDGIQGMVASQAGRQLQYEDGTPIPSVPSSGYTLPAGIQGAALSTNASLTIGDIVVNAAGGDPSEVREAVTMGVLDAIEQGGPAYQMFRRLTVQAAATGG